MSSMPAGRNPIADQPDRRFGIGAEATERAGRRLIAALFSGIVVLAFVGIGVSAITGSMMTHEHHSLASAGTMSAAVTVPHRISLFVAPSWKPGPGGERHDAFSKTNFNVRAGQQVQLTIDNRDGAVHSITAAAANVNIVVMPGVHTYMLVVRQAGRFKWICAYACDPFSMGHTGYMQGYITAT